ncbi:hypothetical protein DYB28_003470 [Aphanomyces astaci]|uniref:Uncharacterized protein n=1 Tax=Aphanomyces astaci TaxID=112090 RepID=A0A9X8E9R7_APHAT|nr:hypothetical protein DYB28_003470 [Aphanomyces astaci]
MDKWESARNKKVTKLQSSANKSLGRETKIEGIMSVTTTLLDTGSDVTLVTAGVLKSLERAGEEVNVISPELSVIQPHGQGPALKCSSSGSPWTPPVDVDSRPGWTLPPTRQSS